MSVQMRQANGNAGRPEDAGVLAQAEQEPKSRRRSIATVVTGMGVFIEQGAAESRVGMRRQGRSDRRGRGGAVLRQGHRARSVALGAVQERHEGTRKARLRIVVAKNSSYLGCRSYDRCVASFDDWPFRPLKPN